MLTTIYCEFLIFNFKKLHEKGKRPLFFIKIVCQFWSAYYESIPFLTARCKLYSASAASRIPFSSMSHINHEVSWVIISFPTACFKASASTASIFPFKSASPKVVGQAEVRFYYHYKDTTFKIIVYCPCKGGPCLRRNHIFFRPRGQCKTR